MPSENGLFALIAFQLLLQSLPSRVISATCYHPNGTVQTDPDYQPCDALGTFSMCCATANRKYPDQCLSNGLCLAPNNEYWRESCTDPTWESPFCLKDVCTDPSEAGSFAGADAGVSQCPTGGEWCCGGLVNATECCSGDMTRVDIAATIGVSSSSSTVSGSRSTSSTSSTTSISSTIATSSLTNIASSSTSTSSSLPLSASTTEIAKSTSSNNGEEVGLGVGIGVGVGATCLIGAAIYFLVALRKRKGRKGRQEFDDTEVSWNKEIPSAELNTERRERFEMPTMSSYAEAP